VSVKIEAIRCETETIKSQFPALYREQKKHKIAATITLFSPNANAQVYEYENGVYRFFYGSRALANRWAGRAI
jgi:hypothetical protein